MSNVRTVIKFRRGTADEWATSSPQPIGEILKIGEPGYEKDTGKLKIGDGIKGWNELPYVQNSNSEDVILTPEDVEQVVGNLIIAGDGISVEHNNDTNELKISNTKQTYDAAVEWTPNHTIDNGTRYLVGDLVYHSGNLYKANYENESMPVTNTLYWTDLGPGYRLNIDGRDIQNIPFPVTSINNQTGAITIDPGLPLTYNNYIICKNGDNLISKYAAAKLLTPGGNPLSSINRATLIIMPGSYSLSTELVINTQYVDIFGLGSIKLGRGCQPAVILLNNTINITANDVRVKGISTGTQAFKIGNNLSSQVIEDCAGGNNSFNADILSGKFIHCMAGNNSYAYQQNASGTFNNCIGGNFSFGSSNTMSPGDILGQASGEFNNCDGGSNSFAGGYSTVATGIFKHCTAGSGSFGGTTTVPSPHTGKFMYCQLTSGTFPGLGVGGKIRLCIDGNYNVVNDG